MSAENKLGKYHLNKKQVVVSGLSGIATGVVVLNLGPVGVPIGIGVGTFLYSAGTILTGVVDKQVEKEVGEELRRKD